MSSLDDGTKGVLFLRRALVPYLSKASHLPTPFLSAFLLVHLSAPLMANLGGSSLSSQVMLLGREYYQGQASEILVVFAPLALHISASTLKRLISPIHPRPVLSLLSAAGYACAFILPLHVLIHRVYPTDPAIPISALGPAQLDFTFVQYALQVWPVRNSLMYTALVAATLTHALEGAALLWDLYCVSPGVVLRRRKDNVIRRRVLNATGILISMGSLFAIWSEPLATPLPSLIHSFDAVFKKLFIFRL
ncbi:hypothetical protein EW145_g5825 [Phellinidium pouzarii]|uniref:Mitochondrial adapter protein MCP1 transmembrane domain-containing protein n=1 Tax=Phellinidium pouzarii TaxID=167371 RepID=A0A4S4L3F8_9AGAM|nr:hypothetical protein EW145_g5825 [Phellinidium pouzarii]